MHNWYAPRWKPAPVHCLPRPIHRSNSQKKSPGNPGFLLALLRLRGADVRSLIPFGPGGLVKRDLLIFLERFKTVALDRREMRKQILASIVRGNEAKTFCIVEPLDRT